jgi:hypothetical protein
MGGSRNTHGTDGNSIQNFSRKVKERDYLGEIRIQGVSKVL